MTAKINRREFHEERIHSLLLSCSGQQNAITTPALCKRLGWPRGRERGVRRVIAAKANSEWPGVLCAVPGVGYFFATDLNEIFAYRNHLVGLKKAAADKLWQFESAAKKAGFSLKEAA